MSKKIIERIVMEMVKTCTGYFQDGRFISPEANLIPDNVEVCIVITGNVLTEKSLDEKIMEIIKAKNIPHETLECDENGHVIIDKDKQPELYDWVVNG